MKLLRDSLMYFLRNSTEKSESHRRSSAGGNSKPPLNLPLARPKRGSSILARAAWLLFYFYRCPCLQPNHRLVAAPGSKPTVTSFRSRPKGGTWSAASSLCRAGTRIPPGRRFGWLRLLSRAMPKSAHPNRSLSPKEGPEVRRSRASRSSWFPRPNCDQRGTATLCSGTSGARSFPGRRCFAPRYPKLSCKR